jgi:hypothetical protein
MEVLKSHKALYHSVKEVPVPKTKSFQANYDSFYLQKTPRRDRISVEIL